MLHAVDQSGLLFLSSSVSSCGPRHGCQSQRGRNTKFPGSASSLFSNGTRAPRAKHQVWAQRGVVQYDGLGKEVHPAPQHSATTIQSRSKKGVVMRIFKCTRSSGCALVNSSIIHVISQPSTGDRSASCQQQSRPRHVQVWQQVRIERVY